ncbi:MAG: hypothetical protein A2V83_03685 [Nitrospirae bacterium RBG_16_64_22]|nr:MAG: hypothetical protein A2V83_03685 [Nitrospirae bacterium RBG_16_64_22]
MRPLDRQIVYFNGRFLPAGRACLSIFDRGILYGDGIFETFRSYGGKLFRVRDHLGRLASSAKAVGMALPLPAERLHAILSECLRRNQLRDATLRLTITRGSGTPGDLAPRTDPAHTVFITAKPISPPGPSQVRQGVAAVIIRRFRTDRQGVPPRSKTTSRLLGILARREAKDAGAFEGILLNDKGEITEGTTTNIFWVRKGMLYTPPFRAGILPGITRAVTLEAARRIGLPVRLETGRPARLYRADEVFLTGTSIEVLSVSGVDGRRIGTGRPGPVTRRLQEAFRQIVETETHSKLAPPEKRR